jgi:hypothetical protein
MSEREQVEKRGASAWKWILGVGGCIVLALALAVYGSTAYLFAKGKPQVAAALESVQADQKSRDKSRVRLAKRAK